MANIYRLELDKLLLGITTAVFAFTVTFRPALKLPPNGECLLWIGWVGLAASLIGGVFELHGWERFYIAYRDYDYKAFRGPIDKTMSEDDAEEFRQAGKDARKTITLWRRAARTVQFAGFFIGVASIAIFSALNIANVAPKP